MEQPTISTEPTVDAPTAVEQAARDERRMMWKDAIEQELQDLITQAADIRQKISSAKTDVKRRYYKKKFDKVSPQVMQMVAALERLNQDNGDMVA